MTVTRHNIAECVDVLPSYLDSDRAIPWQHWECILECFSGSIRVVSSVGCWILAFYPFETCGDIKFETCLDVPRSRTLIHQIFQNQRVRRARPPLRFSFSSNLFQFEANVGWLWRMAKGHRLMALATNDAAKRKSALFKGKTTPTISHGVSTL